MDDIWRVLAISCSSLVIASITFWLGYAKNLVTDVRVKEIIQSELGNHERSIDRRHSEEIRTLELKVAKIETTLDMMVTRFDEVIKKLEKFVSHDKN